ncbi:cupin domain-containing protein [Pedobacter metabolipauper]|uniref:Cupin domain-containing protein n=1 Tax=Pedobacter metabolipauper TaxID=425513 RepID=A0A4R6SYR8_9SPHI|nr:cupin domain-containing protein [Pedobacter metabolipauper]TDQ11207.1 Cupin domain-containing protein [Pedobacter metabolipauper]
MEDLQELIETGLLELYVLGDTNEQDNLLIEKIGAANPQLWAEVDAIGLALEKYALDNGIVSNPIILPFLMATIDFSDRMQAGETPVIAPILHEGAVAADYQQFLERKDMIMPDNFKDVFARILSYTPEAITAIVWISQMAPQEVHDHEYERFLILEGTCDIHIEEDIFHLVPGDYLQIPLHKSHHVMVTSKIPCKVILQRVAA